jgi:hypothetical protein
MSSLKAIRPARRGTSVISFAFLSPLMIALLLGLVGVGVNLLRTHQTIQVARDAGHMYARGTELWKTGYQQILARLGSNIGLKVDPATSNAVVILSLVTYVDIPTCVAAGCPLDLSGNPIGCTNQNKWVFAQRWAIGKPGVRTSNFGSPLTSGPTGVTIDPQTGKISIQDYAKKAGAVAQFTGINPYAKAVDGSVSGLPSREVIYVAEAASQGLGLPPFTPMIVTNYSFSMF